MARTTTTLVQGIIEVDSSISLDPFITVANRLVTKLLDEESGLTTEDLELIERWLSAHFYAVRDPRTTAERAGPVSANFEGKTAMYFEFTRYGQMAMLLDTTGILSNLSQNAGKTTITASATWMGDEDDRGDVED